MNPLELLVGAVAGLFVGNRLARQNLDPAAYTAARIRYRTKFAKVVYATLGVMCVWMGMALMYSGSGGVGVWLVLASAGFFVWGWAVAPRRIVKRESHRHAREQQASAAESARLERGELRPEDPEYWRQ